MIEGRVYKLLKGIYLCGIKFFRYNYFCRHISREKGCFFYPQRHSIIRFAPESKLILKGDFSFNAGRYPHSKAEAYLILDHGSQMIVCGNTRVNYGSTIHLNKDSVLEIGSMTTNVGINIQCKKSIQIGADCMLGRNVMIFDSSYHPTGMSAKTMKINSESVILKNHVWIGAGAFVMAGTILNDGCIVGTKAFVRGEYPAGTMVMVKEDLPSFSGMMWARDESDESISAALQYYGSLEQSEELQIEYQQEIYDKILRLLTSEYPGVDFKTESGLLTNHVLDSLMVVHLVELLSQEFNIKISYSEISAKYLDDIERIASLISYKLKDKPSVDAEKYNTLVEYIKCHANNTPNKIALISTTGEITYEDLYSKVRKYASYLKKQGLQRGDIVVVKAKQSLEFLIIYLAIHFCDATITSVERDASRDKLQSIIELTDARMLIIDKGTEKFAVETLYYDDFLKNGLSENEADENSIPKAEDTADILFTTGTTGNSKGVELSHKAVLAGAENIVFGCEITKDTVLVVPNPLSHSNAIKNFGACMIVGCSFYVLDGISDLGAYFNALDYARGKVATVLPPAALRTIFTVAKDKLQSYDKSLDYMMVATAPLLEPDREELRKLLPNVRLYNHYGCSESSSTCIYDFNKYAQLKNCVGKAMPNSKVMFVDDNRNEIVSSKDNIGLLAVSGNATMKGYFHSEKETKEVLSDGVVYTKDMGYIDQDGFVYILGRNDDVINVGGLKVAPTEVEAAVLSYPDIQDCICIAVPDKITGSALKLLVVSDSFDEEGMILFLKEKLEQYKVPKLYEVVDHIERTYNGKVNRKYYR